MSPPIGVWAGRAAGTARSNSQSNRRVLFIREFYPDLPRPIPAAEDLPGHRSDHHEIAPGIARHQRLAAAGGVHPEGRTERRAVRREALREGAGLAVRAGAELRP